MAYFSVSSSFHTIPCSFIWVLSEYCGLSDLHWCKLISHSYKPNSYTKYLLFKILVGVQIWKAKQMHFCRTNLSVNKYLINIQGWLSMIGILDCLYHVNSFTYLLNNNNDPNKIYYMYSTEILSTWNSPQFILSRDYGYH